MLVTFLIPCHDEKDALPLLFDLLQDLPRIVGPGRFPEVLFVDDGSTDGTADLLQAIASRLWIPARVLALEPNRGIGAAIREGARLAAGAIVVTYDADRPYPIEDARGLVDAVAAGHDVATASPWHPAGGADGVGVHRTFLSKAVSLLYRLRLGGRARGLHTFTCGFRAYRTATLLAALPRADGFVSTAEILLRALANGARVTELPSRLRVRTEGRSKLKSLRTALAHVRLLLTVPRAAAAPAAFKTPPGP